MDFQWAIKINESKSNYTTSNTTPPVSLNNKSVANSDTVKYLGLLFDKPGLNIFIIQKSRGTVDSHFFSISSVNPQNLT